MLLFRLNIFSCKFMLACVNSFRVEMPKYAVAVGKTIGVFDTWPECQKQVQGYPNAKYKKFDTQQQAEDFIQMFTKTDTCDAHFSVENTNRPPVFKVEKVSPSDSVMNSVCTRLSLLEERFSKFITETSTKLDDISARLLVVEGKRKATSELETPVKKIKLEPLEPGDLVTNENGLVVVYTDGACSFNGRMGAKAGIGVWFNYDHPLNISAPVKGPPTNNTAEIQAARMAIKQAHKASIPKLNIRTDSKFLINCITEWIHKWKKNDWKLSNGGPVKNKEELIKLDKAVKKLEVVQWDYVAGHKGIVGNEMADRLARAGAEEYRSNLTFGDSQDSPTVS